MAKNIIFRRSETVWNTCSPYISRSYGQGNLQDTIEVAYRRSALNVISTFNTVSTDAAVVISGMIPVKLIVDIERRKHGTRRGIDLLNPIQIVDDAMAKCQQDWANSLPSIVNRTQRKHGQVNFYLTQLLTGHGCYKAYLYKYGHDVNEAIPECCNERQTAPHVFFTCPKYVDQRNYLERTIGFKVTTDNNR